MAENIQRCYNIRCRYEINNMEINAIVGLTMINFGLFLLLVVRGE